MTDPVKSPAEENTDRISTGKLSRSVSLGMVAAKIGLKHVGRLGKNRRTGAEGEAEKQAEQTRYEREIGQILFQALNQLKGTALKASQILSLEVDFLPEGIREELAKACYQATPLNKALIHKVFRQEFNQSPYDMFLRFDDPAFAAASLGQVHKAQLPDGSDVAVKIQYPGIAASISNDIALLKRLLSILSSTTDLIPDRNVIDIVLSEIELQLEREVDYQLEAQHINWFSAHLTSSHIVIPGIHPTFSGDRVLTMHYLTGVHLEEWLATGPDQASRDHYGQLLFDVFIKSFFELGCLHADPHPGNFLFMENGQLGLLDFGCVKKISPPFPQEQAHFYNLLMRHQDKACLPELRQAYLSMGLIDAHLDQKTFDQKLQPKLQDMQVWCIEPFLNDEFDFSQKSPLPPLNSEEAREAMPFLKGMPRDLLYFDRTYHGMIHMLKRVGGRVRTKNPWITRERLQDLST